jgi:cell division protein FtsW
MRRECLCVVGLVLALVTIGAMTVYSANSVYESVNGLMMKHVGYIGLGLVVMAVGSQFDYHRLGNPFVVRFIAVLSLTLLAAVLVPGIGIEHKGARRWINILGFVFQPSEVAKFAILLYLAAGLSKKQDEIGSFSRVYLPHAGAIVLVAALIVCEKDLGTPTVLAAAGFVVLFVAGVPWRYLAPTFLAGAGAVLTLVATTGYRARRLTAFLDPWSHRDEEGYQLIQSMTAFVNGSYWGRGPGGGEQKLFYLPMANTDFIFAVWGEETGVAGSVFLAGLFVALIAVSLRIAMNARDLFGTLLAGGAVSLIGLQAAFNMMVSVGLLPTKGLPLPFISMGGTSLIIFLGLMGIVLNVGLQAEAPRRRLAAVAAA